MKGSLTNLEGKKRLSDGLIAGVMLFIILWVYKQRIYDAHTQLDTHLWNNPFAVGYAWGSFGLVVPVSIGLIFYLGIHRVFWYETGPIGKFVSLLVVLGLPGFAIWHYWIDISKVWHDKIQHDGFLWGALSAFIVFLLYPLLTGAILNRHTRKMWMRVYLTWRLSHPVPHRRIQNRHPKTLNAQRPALFEDHEFDDETKREPSSVS